MTVRRLLDECGSAGAALESALARPDPPPGDSARPALADLLTRADREEREAARLEYSIVTLAEESYPALLREIHDPPAVLYVHGDLGPDEEVRLAVVGSRRASRYGLHVAQELARELGLRGIVAVSGLARGIDAAAHRGALEAGARTIAVLGSGLARLYPAEHADLAARIAERGAVVSEYPLDLGPLPEFFPRRNRVISGLSAGVIVVEAAERSGALVTARLALDQGRELFAIPGSILSPTSAGTNALLRQGVAHFIASAEELLEELPPVFRVALGLPPSPLEEQSKETSDARRGAPDGVGASLSSEDATPAGEETDDRLGSGRQTATGTETMPSGPASRPAARSGLDADERAVLAQLSFEDPPLLDDVATLSNLPFPRVLAAITRLEIRGLAAGLPGGRVGLVRPPPRGRS